jgi:hypothetical protein
MCRVKLATLLEDCYLFQYLYTGELAGGSVLMKMLQVNVCPLPSNMLILLLIDDAVAFE